MNLLFIRHGLAMDREDYAAEYGDQASDESRPLTLDGMRKMRKNAKGLARLIGRPQALVSSPLLRAKQTAQILSAQWKGLDIAYCDALKPEAKPEEFAKWIKRHFDPRNPGEWNGPVIAVGHNPGLPLLLQWLVPFTEKSELILDLKKGGGCWLEFPELPQRSQGKLLWLATPRMFRAMA